jgi:hypothetical protein
VGLALASIALATGLTGWVVRDVLVDHGHVLRGLSRHDVELDADEPIPAPSRDG